MFSLKRSALLSAAVVLGLVCSFVFLAHTSPTQAQDGMDTVTCDSTLVTLLYIAENDYGFHSMLDVSKIDKGQYGPLFESMMAMMEATPEEGMMETTPDTSMMEDMTMLAPGMVAGEDQLCTDLRSELDSFFYDTFTNEMMGDGSGQ